MRLKCARAHVIYNGGILGKPVTRKLDETITLCEHIRHRVAHRMGEIGCVYGWNSNAQP